MCEIVNFILHLYDAEIIIQKLEIAGKIELFWRKQ